MALVAKSELGGQVRYLLVPLRKLHAGSLDPASHDVRHRAVAGGEAEHPGEVKPAHARYAGERAEGEALAEVLFDVDDDAGHGAPVQAAMRRVVVRTQNDAALIGHGLAPPLKAVPRRPPGVTS